MMKAYEEIKTEIHEKSNPMRIILFVGFKKQIVQNKAAGF